MYGLSSFDRRAYSHKKEEMNLTSKIRSKITLAGTAQNGARSMYVTTDLRADLGKGDTIAMDTFRALVLEVGPSKIELDRPYDLNSASGLVLYKVETPNSMRDLLGLESGLADCDTLYCMALKELGMSGVNSICFEMRMMIKIMLQTQQVGRTLR